MSDRGAEIPDDQVRLEEALALVKAPCHILDRYVGPRTITYQVMPTTDVLVSRLASRVRDIGIRLGAASCNVREELGKLYVEITREDSDIPHRLDLPEPEDFRDVFLGLDTSGAQALIRMTKAPHLIVAGTSGCLHGDTRIFDPTDGSNTTIRERWASGVGFHVWARDASGRPQVTAACPPVRYPPAQMIRITLSTGESITVTLQHRILTASGWTTASELYRQRGSWPVLLPSSSASDLRAHARDALRWSCTTPGSLVDCRTDPRSCGEPPPLEATASQAPAPSRGDAPGRTHERSQQDDLACGAGRTQTCPSFDLRSTPGSDPLDVPSHVGAPPARVGRPGSWPQSCPSALPLESGSGVRDTDLGLGSAAPASTAPLETSIHEASDEQSLPQPTPGAIGRYPPIPVRPRTRPEEPQSSLEEDPSDVTAIHHPQPSAEGYEDCTRLGSQSLEQGCRSATAGAPESSRHASCSTSCCLVDDQVVPYEVTMINMILLDQVEPYFDFHVPLYNNYWLAGVWHHNCGKSVLLRNIVRSCSLYPGSMTMIMDPKGGGDFVEGHGLPGEVMLLRDSAKIRTWSSIARTEMEYRQGVRRTPSVLQIPDDVPVVIVVDEVQTVIDDAVVKDNLFRILSMGRSSSIHCVLATQAPSARIMGGNEMRVNAPTRVVLRVATASDSRVALTEAGAEKLLGQGDAYLLYEGRRRRIQVPFLEPERMFEEVRR